MVSTGEVWSPVRQTVGPGQQDAMTITFKGVVWHWRGPAPWYFVTVPARQCRDLQAVAAAVSYGWGMLPATVQIGTTVWKTSLFPKVGHYLVPIKASVRRTEDLAAGDMVAVRVGVG